MRFRPFGNRALRRRGRVTPASRSDGGGFRPASGIVPSVDLHGSGKGTLGFQRPAVDPASAVFSALGDPTRRALVEILARDGEATATALSVTFPMTRQAVTKHLALLADAGIITSERVGKEQRYRLEPAAMDIATTWMRDVGAAWDGRLAALSRRLRKP